MNSPIPGSEYLITAIFALSVITTVVGALIAVITTRIIRCVCGLVICCMGMAGLYYFLHSPFLALMEILIYVGAVCVTIVFAIMLAEPEEPITKELPQPPALWFTGAALVVSGAIFWGMTRLVTQETWGPPATPPSDDSVHAIGISLLTTYSLAFELISVALLVAIVGALAIARPGKTKSLS